MLTILLVCQLHMRPSEDSLWFCGCNQKDRFDFLKDKKLPKVCISICMYVYVYL